MVAFARAAHHFQRLHYPHLPKLMVQTTRAADYAALVPEIAA